MEPLPKGEADPDTSFLMLNEGKLIFDGSTHDLVHSDDPFIRDYLS
jgi:phospholipid/cholesterol/gamma-HCH transport system ATP-binding protein